MNAQDFVTAFLSSDHGQRAASTLASQGMAPEVAQQYLEHAATAGHEHVEHHGSGLLGDNAGKSFFAAFTAGLIKGDGFLGSIGDGLEGVLVGRITEAIVTRAGVDPALAATVAAAVTPYVASFVKGKLSSS